MIRFENVGLRYGAGDEVLRDLTFQLAPGSFHFLSGPSGAGKSSLLRLLYLEQRPSRGQMVVLDEDVTILPRDALPPLRRQIGVVFQDFRLIDHLSVYDNIALPLKIMGRDLSTEHDNILELLDWVGLSHRASERPATLSGGEKQRAAIARAVVGRPRLLLADEPTGNVDPAMGVQLLNLFDQLHKTGTTIVVATHDMGLVERFGHPVLYLDGGRLQQIDSSEVHALAHAEDETVQFSFLPEVEDGQ